MPVLRYLLEIKTDQLIVQIQEEGAKSRVLYWDLLTKLATSVDLEPLLFLKKEMMRFHRNFETLPFQKIEIALEKSFEFLSLLIKTKRIFYQGKLVKIVWDVPKTIFWRESQDFLSAWIEEDGAFLGLESIDHLFPKWGLTQGLLFRHECGVSWKWIQAFRKGALLLDDLKRKRFLEEDPILEKEEKKPILILTDPTGCFAKLKHFDRSFEKDLLEVGYIKKGIDSDLFYFIPSDLAREALLLLLDVGWQLVTHQGKKIMRQTALSLAKGKDQVEERAQFGAYEKEMTSSSFFVDLDQDCVGIIDLKIKPKELEEKKVSSLFQGTLLPHQQKGVDWLYFLYEAKAGALLADEMGLGKTVQVLAFFSLLRRKLPILIVAPSSLLVHWSLEIQKFLPSFKVLIYEGLERKLDEGFDCIVTSYAILRLDLEELQKQEWEIVLLDESSMIKTATTQTAKAACSLKASFRIALNGTPVENRKEELFSQMSFLIKNPKNQKLSPYILRRKKDQISLPPKWEQKVWIDMNPTQKMEYERLKEENQKGILRKIAQEGASSCRMEALEAILRLRQVAIDPRLFGKEEKGSKIERVLEDLEEILSENRKVLIYSQFTSFLTLLKKELTVPYLYLDGSTPPKERGALVQRFQEEKGSSLFLLSLKAGGVGLNLTAADYVLLLDPWWNEAVENQAIDRAHRIGRTDAVIARRYLSLETIEAKIDEIKLKKKKEADLLFDRLEHEDSFLDEKELIYLLS